MVDFVASSHPDHTQCNTRVDGIHVPGAPRSSRVQTLVSRDVARDLSVTTL
jgi:hypothetical protein